ncbi:hypothetical protein A9498_30115 (plasmid) [Bacillus thuringiensis serovar coreanensis]|nr:hypothetical protein A9498_30115 [Bacillus thuringiensis serovar coreanensis]
MLFNIHFKKLLTLVMVIILLATLLLFFNRSNSVNAAGNKDFSGEELYKGIIFGQGEVANLFPEVWNEEKTSNVNNKESLKITTMIVNEMKLSDPFYFINLKKAVNSKQPLEVYQAFENGSYLLNQAINKLKLDNYNSKSLNQAGLGMIAIVDNSRYYYTYYYGTLEENFKLSPLAHVKTSKNLEQEQFIQNIVNRLSY